MASSLTGEGLPVIEVTHSLQVKTNKAGVSIYYAVLRYKQGGKWQSKWKSTGLIVKDNKKRAMAVAKQFAIEYENELNTKPEHELNAETVNSNVSFLEYFEYCLDGRIKNTVEPNTYDGYRGYYDVHIKPYFESRELQLNQVSRKTLQAFYDEKLAKGRLDGKGGLSAKTVKKFWVVINRVLTFACQDEELIELNPNLNCRVEKNQENIYEAPFYSAKEVARLLTFVKENEPFYLMVVFGAYYGLRRSEVMGLRWDAIDLENDTVTIKHKAVISRQQEYRRSKTKNNSSRRILPLFPEVKKMLAAMKIEQNSNKQLFGNCYKANENYIFVWEDGTKIRADYPSRRLYKIVKENNLPKMNFHGLRHSSASILISKGFSLLHVSKFLGHSSTAITGSVYGHLFDEGKSDMANMMNDLLEKAKTQFSLENSLELGIPG